MDVLGATLRPLSAYDLMEALWTRGVRAATTVYRSLHRLTGPGLVHRLESVNAYVACSHDGDHAGVVFADLRELRNVREFTDANIIEGSALARRPSGFPWNTPRLS